MRCFRSKYLQKQTPEVFYKKYILKNFVKFTGKYPCRSLSFLTKLQGSSCNFIDKETLAQLFSCELNERFQKTFFTEYLPEKLPKSSLLKIFHTYPPMMEVGTVIPYLKKIQKLYESCDTTFEFW